MAKYVCTVCGYVYEGETLPADFKCPLCGVGADKFKKIEGEMTLAAEHEYGVYDSTVKQRRRFRRRQGLYPGAAEGKLHRRVL